ncbi:MAG: outer membrane protein assembly factor BamA [Micavibrio sp.]|nr:outer membrane protein assembly factor BamA [Micavibrio sp.]|tara:strand:+ start:532 stop:2865 length:2334 start_codon:yes stop_codon:yes gene_type:complete
MPMPIYVILIALLSFASLPMQAANAQTESKDYFWLDSGNKNAVVVDKIVIEGNQRIERNTIISYLDIREGDKVSDDKVSRSLRNLFATGLFADVAVVPRGSTILVKVVENPVINEIAFEGNKRLKDEDLLAEVNLRPRTVLTRTRVQENVDRLYELYRRGGRFSTSIDPKIIKLDQNRVNLVFEIDEGEITKIEKITFIGNERFSDAELRSELASKQDQWYRFFSSSDRYDADRLNYDQELLRRFYLKHGYADFNVRSANAELSKSKDRFYITMYIEEGDRYKVSDVKITSDIKNYDPEQLRPFVTIESGEWYNADDVQDTVEALTDELGNQQYAFVDVKPNVKRNGVDKTVSITLHINETPRVFVEAIDIKGNLRTLDKVVRREFQFVEGDPFNRQKLAESEKKIKDLGFFESVKVTPKPGTKPDTTIIEAEVAEQSTGEISIGAGFSTNDGPLADFRIRERNLLGTGRDLGFKTVLAGQRSEFDLALSEPYFLNRDLRATGNIFKTTRDFQDESSFDQDRTGVGYSLEYPLSKYLRQEARYRFENNKITDVAPTASLFIRAQEGSRTTSAVSQRLSYDRRDSKLNPREGYNIWWDTELAGLGGNAKYVSGTLGGQNFVPLGDDWVLSLLGEGGHILGYADEDVTISERYFLGSYNLRGFQRSGIGPRDLVSTDALGGNTFARGSVELSTPFEYGGLDDQNVKLHTFFDFGTLFGLDDSNLPGTTVVNSKSIRSAVGVGLSWGSPFGPLRVDLAAPVTKEDYDETESFKFSFGTRF